jgi:adenylate kinase family enzyme
VNDNPEAINQRIKECNENNLPVIVWESKDISQADKI